MSSASVFEFLQYRAAYSRAKQEILDAPDDYPADQLLREIDQALGADRYPAVRKALEDLLAGRPMRGVHEFGARPGWAQTPV